MIVSISVCQSMMSCDAGRDTITTSMIYVSLEMHLGYVASLDAACHSLAPQLCGPTYETQLLLGTSSNEDSVTTCKCQQLIIFQNCQLPLE